MAKTDFLSPKSLLQTPISELNLRLPSQYREGIKVLYSQLHSKGIRWRPHYWLSDEWYSPDGVDGFAIPFTLAHPKLIALEKKIVGTCEGEKKREFFKLCCHETGHAIDNAFLLRKNKKRQKLFGLSSEAYPQYYVPLKNSQYYVTHLKDHYAQAHPEEDWAETFAVWLSRNNWERIYKGLPVLQKLQCVDEIMHKVRITNPKKVKPSKSLSYKFDERTVEEYLLEKRKQLHPENYFQDKVEDYFSTSDYQESAYFFLLKNKEQIIKSYPAIHPWYVNRCFEDIARACREKKLRLKYSKRQSLNLMQNMIEQNLQEYIQKGHPRVNM